MAVVVRATRGRARLQGTLAPEMAPVAVDLWVSDLPFARPPWPERTPGVMLSLCSVSVSFLASPWLVKPRRHHQEGPSQPGANPPRAARESEQP